MILIGAPIARNFRPRLAERFGHPDVDIDEVHLGTSRPGLTEGVLFRPQDPRRFAAGHGSTCWHQLEDRIRWDAFPSRYAPARTRGSAAIHRCVSLSPHARPNGRALSSLCSLGPIRPRRQLCFASTAVSNKSTNWGEFSSGVALKAGPELGWMISSEMDSTFS